MSSSTTRSPALDAVERWGARPSDRWGAWRSEWPGEHPERRRAAARFERRAVDVAGRRITYQTAGAGEPVVLVHGLAGSLRWWRRNAPALAERHALYLVNLPGFGAFGRRRERFALAEAADWLAAWIRAVGIGPCHLIGHSMGGFLAIRLAARQPELVRRLALVAPAGLPTGRPLLRYAGPLVATGLAATPSFLPILALDAICAGPRTILRAARDLLAEDARADLRRVGAPTLLVWGARDALVPPSLGPVMQAAIPDARLVVLPGAGHVPQYDRPPEFNAAVLGFLASERAGERAAGGNAAGGSAAGRPARMP